MKDLRFDEKGKFFTTHVSKQLAWATIATTSNVFRGTLHLMPENRLKDELNSGERFIALTKAQVYAADGATLLYSVPVVVLNKEQIVWVMPQGDAADDDTPGD